MTKAIDREQFFFKLPLPDNKYFAGSNIAYVAIEAPSAYYC